MIFETDISIPTFRDFRVRHSAINSAVLYPNRVGAKFSNKEISILKNWAKQNNLDISGSPTKIKIIRTDLKPLDLSMHGARGVKAELYEKKRKAEKKEREEKKKYLKEKFYKRPSARWIEDVFGKDFANITNKTFFADFLEGNSEKPALILTHKWRRGLMQLNALDKSGKINWNKVKKGYKDEKEKL